jgi:hypothetical protein
MVKEWRGILSYARTHACDSKINNFPEAISPIGAISLFTISFYGAQWRNRAGHTGRQTGRRYLDDAV